MNKSKWGKPMLLTPDAHPTAFERMLATRGLNTEDEILSDLYAKQWAEHYANQSYVPERFLRAWKITPEANFS